MELQKRSDGNDSKNLKRTHGIANLPQNIKPIDAEFSMEILKEVDDEDKEHMILIIEYCCYNIAKKSDDVKLHIIGDKKGGTYQLFATFPTNIKISSTHFDDLRKYSLCKITEDIVVEYNEKKNNFVYRIIINSSKNIEYTENITITQIRLKRTQPMIIYENEKNDDQRGSTKRTRK